MRSWRTWLVVLVVTVGATNSVLHAPVGQAHGSKGSVEVIPGVNTNSISAAEVIPGNECAKVGTTKTISDLKYFCVKTGSKLRWSKGVKMISSKPAPKYSGPRDIFGTATSEEALAVEKLVDIAWEKGKPSTQFVTSYVSDRVKGTTWANDNAAVLPAITRILDGAGAPLSRNVDWYVWWDLVGLQPKLPEYCWAKDTRFFDVKSVGAGFCRPSTIFIFFDAYQQWYPKEGFLEKYPNEWDKFGIVAVTAGEVVHFAQQTYGEKFGHESFNFYPAWLREGPSVLYSAMAYAKHMNIPYSTVRNLALQHFNNYKCGEVPLTDLLSFSQTERFCEYSGGFLASEYLIAKSGDILAPFRYLESKMPGNGEVCQSPYRICRPSYEEVIREIYAKDVDAWHAELQKYIIKWAR
jgi:hypothetical protein